MHDVFVAFARNVPTLRLTTSLRGYLSVSVCNRVRDLYRTEIRHRLEERQVHPGPADVAAPDARASEAELTGRLRAALDQTRIAVAGYLAQMGEVSAIPALQRLAGQWQGPAGENPFLRSIVQIRQASSRQEGSGDEARTPTNPPATAGHDPRITVHVLDEATGCPDPQGRDSDLRPG